MPGARFATRVTAGALTALLLLALRGETVQVETEKTPPVTGQISGLESDGSLKIRNEHGESVTVRFGDVRLRPLA